MSIELRPYQEQAVDGVLRELEKHRATLLVAATGTGKTTIFSEIARLWLEQGRGRVLILAHREELITQAARRVATQTGLRVGIEMAEQRIDPLFPPDVVVATVQTLSKERRRSLLPPEFFGLVIVDEAHHAVADTYGSVIDYFAGAKVLGVTATPDRGDGAAMRQVFESVAYVYEIRDAIEQGYLCQIRQKAVRIEGLDLSSVRTVAGDLNEGDLEGVMLDDENIQAIASATLQEAGSRPTMLFGVTVAHAHALAAALNRYQPGCARALDGKSDRDLRRDTLAAFSRGEFQVLSNCALFTEGFDEPSIACVAVARPTKSRAFYTQMVGRGTRLHPSKRDLLILDFQGNAGRHTLVSPLDILDGNKDAQAKALAAKKMAADPELSILDALDEASREIAERVRAETLAKARYSAVSIDPFAMVTTFLDIAPRPGRWGGQPPAQEDLDYLAERAKGLSVAGMDGGQVAEIVKAIRARYRDRLSSWNQARVLIRAGLDPEVDFTTASATIDVLASNRWKPTEAVRAAYDLLAQRKTAEKAGEMDKARRLHKLEREAFASMRSPRAA
jgi:superfamily II DNA or RNA helicase